MMNIARISGVTLTLAFVAAAWTAQPALAQTSSAEALQNAMKKCAAIADEAARHICSDAVLEGAGLLAPEAPAAERAAPTPQAPVAQTPAPKAPTATSEPAKARQSANLSDARRDAFFPEEKSQRDVEEEVNEIEVTLQDVRKYGNGKFVLTDTEGMTWRQLYTRSTLLPPKSGQSMTVRKNTLGGYMCRVEKSPSFRCSPVS